MDITIIKLENTYTMDEIQKIGAPSIQLNDRKVQKLIENHSFKKVELDQPTVRRRLAHTSEGKLERMCKEEIIKDLPNIYVQKYTLIKKICIIGATTSLPKELQLIQII